MFVTQKLLTIIRFLGIKRKYYIFDKSKQAEMKRFLSLLFIVSLLLFSSCGKRAESRLIGDWEIESVGDCGWAEHASWTFYSGGELLISEDPNIGGEGHTQTGGWEVFTRSLVTPYVKITGFATFGLNGHWRIEKVNSRKLILNRVEWEDGDTGGAFMRREFKRK